MVDALASGASVPRDVEVRVLSRVPYNKLILYVIIIVFMYLVKMSSTIL
jgi:hypothetical protein